MTRHKVNHSNEKMDASPNKTILTEVRDSGLEFKHDENSFVDYKLQRLLFHQLSRIGGKVATTDVNKDGNDDIFFGGASGQAGQLYFGKENGTFQDQKTNHGTRTQRART